MVIFMRRFHTGTLLRNLGIIALVVPPVWLGLIWLIELFATGPSDSQYEWNAYLFNVVLLIPQVLLAGLLQQGMLAFWAEGGSRPTWVVTNALAIVTSVVVVVLVASGELYPVLSLVSLVALVATAALVSLGLRKAVSRAEND